MLEVEDKEVILERLREKNFRITKQRQLLLDIILEGKCSCCKEIYYTAVKQDAKIGIATVYRLLNTLEEVGAISRKNTYQIVCNSECERTYSVRLEDETVIHLSVSKLKQIISKGLECYGYTKNQKIKEINVNKM